MEMGLPVLATLFLEITSPVILLMIAAFLVHEATVYWDLRGHPARGGAGADRWCIVSWK
jgi:hypothetical protein